MRLPAIFIALLLLSACAQAQDVPNRADQIAAATQAAPAESRPEATVLGYDAAGQRVTLREGSNSLVCVADDPNRKGFEVVCYHRDLQPFMDRGRALRAEGKGGTDIFEIREKEARAGTLKMPEQPTTLHILSGRDARFDRDSGKVVDGAYRYVVYIPFATAESTGLPTRPTVPGGPWIMDPGTHKAHIMVTPPASGK